MEPDAEMERPRVQRHDDTVMKSIGNIISALVVAVLVWVGVTIRDIQTSFVALPTIFALRTELNDVRNEARQRNDMQDAEIKRVSDEQQRRTFLFGGKIQDKKNAH
jgi:hypothetical protein